MAAAKKNFRWSAPAEVFARTLSLEDDEIPRGWLKNSVVIEPGTRACAMVDGRFLGEIPAGEFTFHTFRDKLQFWRKGQATILLTRADVVRLPVDCDGFVTADEMPIDMRIDVGVQVDDPVLFMKNLMGPRSEYPVHELAKRLTPAVKQEAWVATARLNAADLRGPAVAMQVAQQVIAAIAPGFRRYGLRVINIEGLRMQPSGMESHWEKVKENAVQLAGERLDNQRLGDDIGILTERIGLREKLRDVAVSDEFDKAKTAEELKQLLAGVDKDRLLRKEEMDELVEGFEQRKDDRTALREHITAVLDIHRGQELEQLRTQVSHTLDLAAKKNELELAEATNSVENLEWRNEVAREIEAAEKRREERKKELAAKWERIRETQRQKNDSSWESLLHRQKEADLRSELAIKEAERKRRGELLEAEAAAQVESQKIIAERQRREFELEMGGRESDAQFDRLKRVQDMNFEGHARQAQLDADLAGQAESRANSHEIEKLKTMGSLSAEALIAGSNADNARALAELKMQEAKSQADIQAAVGTDQQALNEERLRLYEKLSEAEKSKADAIADVFQQALRGQQTAVEQMISGLASAHTPAKPSPTVSPSPPPLAAPSAATWHVAIGGQQSGPHTAEHVRGLLHQGQITVETLVWKAGMAGWVAISDCPDLTASQSPVPPPPPFPS